MERTFETEGHWDIVLGTERLFQSLTSTGLLTMNDHPMQRSYYGCLPVAGVAVQPRLWLAALAVGFVVVPGVMPLILSLYLRGIDRREGVCLLHEQAMPCGRFYHWVLEGTHPGRP